MNAALRFPSGRHLVPGFQERLDFLENGFTAFVPLLRAAENEDAFAHAGETDFLGAMATEFFELGAEFLEECEFVAAAGFHRGMYQGNRKWRRDRLEMLGDVFAADFHEHLPDFLEQLVKVEQAEFAGLFEILDDAAADLTDEREVIQIRRLRRAEEGVIQPRGIVVEHLMASDLDGGAIADE